MKESKSQLKIGVILNYANIICGNLIPLFYTPVMLSLLGQSEYGLYKLANSVTSYLALISMGIGVSVNRYLIKANIEQGKEYEERVLGLFMLVFRIIAIVTFIVGIVIIFLLPTFYGDSLTSDEMRRMKILVFLLVINTALNFSMAPYNSVVTAHERFIFSQIIAISLTCVGPLLNLAMLLFGFASIGMTCSTLFMSIVVRFVYLVYVRKSMQMKPIYKNLPVYLLKEILIFSFWIFVGNIASQLYNATDSVMIGMVPALATMGVAVYSVGGTFNNMVIGFTSGVSNLLSPRANKMVFSKATDEELTSMAVKVGRLQGLVVAFVISGFIAFGQPFVKFYVGDSYSEAYWVAVFMMLPNVIPLMQTFCLSIVVAQNKHKFRSIVYLGIAISNVIGTWFFMKVWGIIGAAFMTGLATFIGNGIIMNIYYHKKTNILIGKFWKDSLKVLIVPVVLCIATLLLSGIINFNNIYIFLVGIIVYSILFVVINWIFIFNDYEKDLFVGFIKRFIKKVKRKKVNV